MIDHARAEQGNNNNPGLNGPNKQPKKVSKEKMPHPKNQIKNEMDIIKRVDWLIGQERDHDASPKPRFPRAYMVLLSILTLLLIYLLYQKLNSTHAAQVWLESNTARIKNDMLDQTVSGKRLGADTLLARRIHQFNMDYYGPKLSIDHERFLYTYIRYHGNNPDDLCRLNRLFSGDSTMALREWLLPKLISSASQVRLANPRIIDLNIKVQEQRREFRKQLARSFAPTIRDSIINYIRISGASEDGLLKCVEKFVATHPQFLEKDERLLNRLTTADQELNIRLGLYQIQLGKEYGAEDGSALFGWMMADYRGARFFKHYSGQAYQAEFWEKLKDSWTDIKKQLRKNRFFYKRLKLASRSGFHLLNPLRLPLEIKNLGLFGARRKNNAHGIYAHRGVDLVADAGTDVYPVMDGFVIYAGYQRNGHGNHLKIAHDAGFISVYSHLRSDALWRKTMRRFLQSGSFYVKRSTIIGHVGTTGNIPRYDAQYGYAHLHLEITIKGRTVNALPFFDLPYSVHP